MKVRKELAMILLRIDEGKHNIEEMICSRSSYKFDSLQQPLHHYSSMFDNEHQAIHTDESYLAAKTYFEPLKEGETRMTACASSTINLDSLLESISSSNDEQVKENKLCSNMTSMTSTCTSVTSIRSSAAHVSSTSLNNFLAFSGDRRAKVRGMSRSTRITTNLAALCNSPSTVDDDSSIDSSHGRMRDSGVKRSLAESGDKESTWGYFFDDESDGSVDLEVEKSPIARVLDDSSWGYFADTVADN